MPIYRVGNNLYAVVAVRGQGQGGAVNTAGTAYGPWTAPTPVGETYWDSRQEARSSLGGPFAEVVESSDDAQENPAEGTTDITSASLNASATNDYIAVRFTELNIPNASTIDSATVLGVLTDSSKNDASGIWYGQAIDDAATFTTANDDISSRTKTTANVAWTTNDLGSAGDWVSSPDLSTIVQEIVNRPGWVAGNDMVLMYVHDSGAEFFQIASFDHTTFPPPQLLLTYTPGPETVAAGVGTLNVEGVAGSPASGMVTLTAGVGTINISGVAGDVPAGDSAAAAVGTINVQGVAAASAVSGMVTVAGGVGAVNVQGVAGSPASGMVTVTAGVGTINIQGVPSPTVTAMEFVTAVPGSVHIQGVAGTFPGVMETALAGVGTINIQGVAGVVPQVWRVTGPSTRQRRILVS